jgi:hypothetical protein
VLHWDVALGWASGRAIHRIVGLAGIKEAFIGRRPSSLTGAQDREVGQPVHCTSCCAECVLLVMKVGMILQAIREEECMQFVQHEQQ